MIDGRFFDSLEGQWNGFLFVPNTSKLSKSEPAYPHSILMQESKDMREKNIEPKIYREVKVTNNG
jgi:hypothetical protein